LEPIRKPTSFDIAFLIVLGCIWGSTFVGIKFALADFTPVWLAFLRSALAFAVLWAYMKMLGLTFPRERRPWLQIAIMSALNPALPFLLVSWAELHVSASVTSLLIGVTPLMALVASHFTTADDRIDGYKITAGAIGFAAVALVLGLEALRGLGADLLAQFAILCAGVCYAVSSAMIRKISGIRIEVMAAMNMGLATAVLLPATALAPLPDFTAASPASLIAIAHLGFLVTGLGYVMRFHAAKTVGQSYMSLAGYLMLPVGVLLGALLLSETISVAVLVALAMIFGAFLIARMGASGQAMPPTHPRPPSP